jgi:predicted Zn-dependent peptidase
MGAAWMRWTMAAAGTLAALSVAWAKVPAGSSAKVARSAKQPAVSVPFEHFVLDNGLEVLVIPDRSLPLVAVDVWYHVGSGAEVPGKSGFAHLFEHMMFQGSKHTGEDAHFDTLRRIGASEINGTTNSDRTNYFEQVPANQLETALWLESDRMGWLLDLVTQKSLDNQREVVRNERRQRYDNVPYGKERFALAAALYPEGHPYRYLTIGRHEDLEAASLDDVKAFFRQWYVPSNATLCLAGDIDAATARKLAQKWFGGLPKVAKPKMQPVATPQLTAPVRQELADPFARLRRLHLTWHSPPSFAAGDAELDLLAHVLANQGTGRLYKQLVLDRRWAQSVAAYQQSQQLSSSFHVVIDLKPDAPLAELEQVVLAELARVRTELVTVAELGRALTDIESQFVWGLEGLMARAELLQGYAHYLGDADRLQWHLERYRQVAVADLQRAARSWLQPSAQVTVVSTPATGGKTP